MANTPTVADLPNQAIPLDNEQDEKNSTSINKPTIAETKVTLDVGGEKFVTYKSTLVKADYFANLFKHNFKLDEVVFVDRNPKMFHMILEFLRIGAPAWMSIYTDLSYETIKMLLCEVDFYAMVNLKQILENRRKSEILKEDETVRYVFRFDALKITKFLREFGRYKIISWYKHRFDKEECVGNSYVTTYKDYFVYIIEADKFAIETHLKIEHDRGSYIESYGCMGKMGDPYQSRPIIGSSI